MPNMTGLELLERVKKEHPKLPVVIISGYSMAVMEDQTKDLKPDGFLGKPLSMSEVEKMLNTLL
jgi:YesN/AraC family two-component response regulator